MNSTFIYALLDPIEKQEFHIYIGKSDNPYIRYYQHLKDKNHSYKTCWIKSLTKENLSPDIQILEIVDQYIWEKKEIEWIKFYREHNYIIVNETNGGDGGYFTKEIQRKMIESRKGRKPNLGNHHSEKTIKNLSKLNMGDKNHFYGKHHSEQTKIKLKESHIGICRSKETRKKMSEGHYGKRRSEETKRKISESHKGICPSDEIKQKISKIKIEKNRQKQHLILFS
jgi:hypothetical protein